MIISKNVINLKSRLDRRRAIGRELKKLGWSVAFTNSVKPDDAQGFVSVGARGCFLSHLSVLRAALRTPGTHVLIMEDDLRFCDKIESEWAACLIALNDADWDILYAGHYEILTSTGLNLIPSETPILCAHFVLFNSRVVEIFVRELAAMLERPAGSPGGGPMHVDGAYSFIRARMPQIRTFAWGPSLGDQRPSRSDIAPNNPFDRHWTLQPAIFIYRLIKERIRRKQ